MARELTPEEKAEIAALEAELAAERARLEEIEDRRKPSPIEAKKAELAAAKRQREEAEILSDLETKHGALGRRIARLDTQGGMVVLKRPVDMAYRRFTERQNNGKFSLEECDKLVRLCLLHPDPARFTTIVEEEPAVLVRATNKLLDLAGTRKDEDAGK